MPIIAIYRHRLIASDFSYPSSRAATQVRGIFVGRTQLVIQQRYGTSATTTLRALRSAVRHHGVLLRPDPSLEDWRWADTKGDYPLGSPYDHV